MPEQRLNASDGAAEAVETLPTCSRCQRKIITFDGSRPTICGDCEQQANASGNATRAVSVWHSVLWAVYTAVALVSVLIACTARTWDVILSACVLCFARGRFGGRP